MIKKITQNKIFKNVFPILFGAAIGFSYYTFIGCYTGTCVITSSPVASTFYGAVLGSLYVFTENTKKKNEGKNGNN